jgi:hypothetical protein
MTCRTAEFKTIGLDQAAVELPNEAEHYEDEPIPAGTHPGSDGGVWW